MEKASYNNDRLWHNYYLHKNYKNIYSQKTDKIYKNQFYTITNNNFYKKPFK